MKALQDTRTIFGIGSGRCDIYREAREWTVEVVCNKGRASWSTQSSDDAWWTFMHPFARADRLSIPGSDVVRDRELTPEEYALVEALGEVEADSTDAIPA